MIDKNRICNKYLKKIGKSISFVNSDGSEEKYFAVIEQTWRKNKSKFEDNSYKLGRHYNDYYVYIGSADFDITVLTNDDYIICDNEKFYFVKKEKVTVGGRIQFYTGILKKIYEEDEYVFDL